MSLPFRGGIATTICSISGRKLCREERLYTVTNPKDASGCHCTVQFVLAIGSSKLLPLTPRCNPVCSVPVSVGNNGFPRYPFMRPDDQELSQTI